MLDVGAAEPGSRPFGYLMALYPIADAAAAADPEKEPIDA